MENILDECAAEIRKCEKKILADCFEIGKQLLKARDALRKYGGETSEGKWLEWLRTDVKMSASKATRYIQVYEKYGTANQFIDVDELKFDVNFYVLTILAAPHADPTAVAEVEKELKQGKKLTVLEVVKRVPSTKPKVKDKTKSRPRLKPKPIAPDEPFLLDLLENIKRWRKEASDVKGKNKQWTHYGIKIADLSCILDRIERMIDDKIQELTRAAS